MRASLLLSTIVLLLAVAACQQRPAPISRSDFAVWLQNFEQDAKSQGISQETLDQAFAGTKPLDRVIELDRQQPESTLTFEQYAARIVSDERVSEGRRLFAEHKTLLKKIGAQYGVQPRFIVALWGIETNFGARTGGFRTIDALATLAYDGRRSEFFRGELINVLRIVQEDHISPDDIKGSWAGAMGQCQFMPSSFLKYAVDYDQRGHRDIWSDQADVFASIANYLHTEGWDPQHGVKEDSHNYKVLLKWNRSRYFALSVGMLADKIDER